VRLRGGEIWEGRADRDGNRCDAGDASVFFFGFIFCSFKSLLQSPRSDHSHQPSDQMAGQRLS
jgi:hypothetical protein